MTSPTPNGSDLDRGIDSARGLTVREDHARARARELMRWGEAAGAKRWTRWLWPCVATATAVVAVLMYVRRTPATHGVRVQTPRAEVVQVGTRVGLVASADARYAIAISNANETRIIIEAGTLSVRLHPGATAHVLRVVARGMEAVAIGTIYTVGIARSGKPYTIVHEGKVRVRQARQERELSAGDAWPRDTRASITVGSAWQALRAHELRAAPVPLVRPIPTPVAADASVPDPAARTMKPVAPAPKPAAPAILWRRARKLRGERAYRRSLAALEQLIRRRDKTWSPIALVEGMRIHADILAQPTQVIRLGGRFVRRYKNHALAAEAIELMCRAYDRTGTTGPALCKTP